MARFRAFIVLAACAAMGCAEEPATPMSGVYTWSAEVNTFRPCGGDKTFWVIAPDSVLQSLRSAHDALVSGEGRGILVTAILRHSGRTPEGFAERYDGLIGVAQVLEVDSSIPPACRETTWALPGRRPTYWP